MNAPILTESELIALLGRERAAGRSVAFANGCFDVLHSGHVRVLEEARVLGDLLVVAVNSDDSVRKLKGEGRPVSKAADRMTIIAALESVDYVTELSGLRATELIQIVQPTIWVKGGDYTLDKLDAAERQAAKSCGAQIVLLPLIGRYSTTTVINLIRNA